MSAVTNTNCAGHCGADATGPQGLVKVGVTVRDLMAW